MHRVASRYAPVPQRSQPPEARPESGALGACALHALPTRSAFFDLLPSIRNDLVQGGYILAPIDALYMIDDCAKFIQ